MSKTLILKLLFLSAIVIGLGLALIFGIPTDENHYMNAIADKHDRLGAINGNKIVIVGGSNTAFGIDSKHISEVMNKPVFNMGIHVGLGLEYILNEVKPYLKEGDIVIFSPEYRHMFWNTESGFDPAYYKTLELYPSSIQYIPVKRQARSIANAFPALMQSKLKSLIFRNGELESEHIKRNKKIYLRNNYNQYGDMTAHLGKTFQHYNKEDDAFRMFEDANIQPSFYHLMNGFNKFLSEKNIKLFFTYAPTPESIYLPSVGEDIAKKLSENLNFPIFGVPRDMTFPDNQFFDTRYHLLDSARLTRTEYLVNHLIDALK